MFLARALLIGVVATSECDTSSFKLPAGRPLPLDEEVLMEKDITFVVDIEGNTDITVINRGRGMTMSEGGHEVFATLDVAKGSEKKSLELRGWTPKTFAGHEFALTGIGEQHGGTDVKVRVTRKRKKK